MNNLLIKVNGEEISENDVIIRLKAKGEYKKSLVEAIETLALKQAAKEQGVEISEDELQVYSDKKRQELGLYSIKDTEKHFNNLGISIDQWADFLEDELLEEKAKKKLFTEKDVLDYYETNKLLYTNAILNKIVVDEECTADEIISQLNEGEDFGELAEDNSVDTVTAEKKGYLGVVKRGVLTPDIEGRIFSAEKGAVVGPFKEKGKFTIYQVKDIVKEELTEELKKDIMEGLFKYWKQNFMASTKIEPV